MRTEGWPAIRRSRSALFRQFVTVNGDLSPCAILHLGLKWAGQSSDHCRMSTHPPARVDFEAIPRNKVYQEVAKQLERRIAEQMKPGDPSGTRAGADARSQPRLGAGRHPQPGNDGSFGTATGNRHGGSSMVSSPARTFASWRIRICSMSDRYPRARPQHHVGGNGSGLFWLKPVAARAIAKAEGAALSAALAAAAQTEPAAPERSAEKSLAGAGRYTGAA